MAEAEDAPDKEQVQKLVDLVEMIVNDQIPPQKGLLSKFSKRWNVTRGLQVLLHLRLYRG